MFFFAMLMGIGHLHIKTVRVQDEIKHCLYILSCSIYVILIVIVEDNTYFSYRNMEYHVQLKGMM